ncbi:MAG TPA: Tex-like N-terminal domain-containing protein, partial [Bdellovibrionales bacterium]|nr:Tex-like N-terminal domain-containing protein [Bdellovibrionales bacterium]
MNFETYLTKVLPGIPQRSAQAVLELHKEGATIPFIARYRKEKTGNLDEVQVREVLEAFEEHQEITKRKAFVLSEIEKQGQLSQDLQERINAANDLAEIDEIYRPFKKKKKTKATVAREAGLEPLANWLWDIGHGTLSDTTPLEIKGKEFLNQPAGIVTYEHALKGAQDIIVEKISNNPDLRLLTRKELFDNGKVISKKTKEFKAHSKYEMYADFSEKVQSLRTQKASHRYLAMRRGWQEGELTLTIEGDMQALEGHFIRYACTNPQSHVAEFLEKCAKTALSAHVHPSISNEIHRLLKDEADRHAITVFSENVKRLLLASPFGAKCVLGVDPGLKTGCKLALIGSSGEYLSHTIFNILDNGAEERAKDLLKELVGRIEAVAVGNGTGGREAFAFFRKVLAALDSKVPVLFVNEAGASVYSASEVAREEFPELDLTVRGAISIARRLQDPLAELVKVDPKSIGVGQYQHDVNQTALKKSLDFVVE